MRKQRRRRGQATLESVIGVMVLSLLFFGLVQVAYIIMADMVAGHAANVTARSHIVGFERKIVKRAAEVGAIAMSGGIRNPAYRGMSNIQLGWLEPQLISEFLQSPGYTIDYERWPQLDLGLPVTESNTTVPITIRARNFPVDMPMSGAYMGRKNITITGRSEMLNHASFYLE